jgi:hypothetical protein
VSLYNPMTAEGIAIQLVDEFHDDIDSDDPPVEYSHTRIDEHRYAVDVRFESGREFTITVEQM